MTSQRGSTSHSIGSTGDDLEFKSVLEGFGTAWYTKFAQKGPSAPDDVKAKVITYAHFTWDDAEITGFDSMTETIQEELARYMKSVIVNIIDNTNK